MDNMDLYTRIALHGTNAISDIELLSNILKSRETAINLYRKVDFSLGKLSKLSITDLSAIKGIGRSKAATLLACIELGKRRVYLNNREKKMFTCSKDLYTIILPYFMDLQYEEFWIILTASGSNILDIVKIGQGGISNVIADPRLILKAAILGNASGLILCHNHPSGNVYPSDCDNKVTNTIKELIKYLQIILLDHIIVSDGAYYSYADIGLI